MRNNEVISYVTDGDSVTYEHKIQVKVVFKIKDSKDNFNTHFNTQNFLIAN